MRTCKNCGVETTGLTELCIPCGNARMMGETTEVTNVEGED